MNPRIADQRHPVPDGWGGYLQTCTAGVTPQDRTTRNLSAGGGGSLVDLYGSSRVTPKPLRKKKWSF